MQRVQGLQHRPRAAHPGLEQLCRYCPPPSGKVEEFPRDVYSPAGLIIRSAATYALASLFPRAAPLFTSSTTPKTTAGAPLPLPSMEVALQRRGSWCCDKKLKTLLFGGVVCCVKARGLPSSPKEGRIFLILIPQYVGTFLR